MSKLTDSANLPTHFNSAHAGLRLDIVLASMVDGISRGQIIKWLQDGHIVIDGEIKKPKYKVKGFESIEFNLPESLPHHDNEPLAQNIPLNIVYQDEYLLIINKPAGLVVHPGAGNHDKTLVNALLYHFPRLNELPRAGIVHRLDKDTTGLLVIAKTLATHNYLVKAMQQRQIKRQYLALVKGNISQSGRIQTQIGRHPSNRIKMAVLKHGGKEAITHYQIKQAFKQHTLLDVQLETGRTHQIRVHMAFSKHPIVGDLIYGGQLVKSKQMGQKLEALLSTFTRQALHAYSLSFKHPATEKLQNFTAPLPEDFQQLLTIMEEDDKNHSA